MAVAIEQPVHAKGSLLFHYFSHFYVTSFPVHGVCSCSCWWTQINQVQMKTKAPLTAMKVERKNFTLPTHIWQACFAKALTLLDAKQPKQLMQLHDLFSAVQMQYRASEVDKIKIESAMISFFMSFNKADQNNFYH